MLMYYPFLMALQFHRNLYFDILFHEFKGFFNYYYLSLKFKDNSSSKNQLYVLKCFHEIMWIIFLLKDNAILLFLHLEPLREFFFFFFSWLGLYFEIQARYISFSLIYKILRAISIFEG